MTSFVTVPASLLRVLAAGLFAAVLAAPAVAQSVPAPSGLPAYSTTYDAARDPQADFAAALGAAAAKQRRVLVMVGGDWCVWCFLLDRHMRLDPAAAQAMYGGFELLRVYYNDENRNQAFLAKFPDFTMFPHFFVVETDGHVLASVPADVLISDAKFDTALMRGFAAKWHIGPVAR